MKLDLNTALKRIISEELRGNNPVPDILGFLHLKHLFKPNFSTEIGSLFKKYEEETQIPEPLLRIDVPKANFTIRPMARPSVRDWLIYEAIIDYLAKEVLKNAEICQRSFSILNFKDRSRKKTNAWLKFDEYCREYYKKGYKYCVTADLTGYYENINLEELRRRILNYLGDNGDKLIIDVLFKLLRKWSDERISGYGLPQGPPASSFLADIYLDYVDRIMEKYEGYFRYMDDIRIFCKREIEAKIALKDLIIALRNVKLNINAKKTSILKSREIEERLFDPHKSLLDIIDTIMESGNKKLIEEKVIPALLKLFEDAFSNDPFEKTHLNFSLYRLSILKNSDFNFDTTKVIQIIKNNFISKPHHTGLFCDFLSMFPNNENIVKFLLEFLKLENNIYEWQELKILQTLLKFDVRINREDIEFFLKSAKDTNKHYAVRGFYFLLVGKYGNNRDRELIVDTYDNSYDSLSETYTKLAVILAVQELGEASRNDFYSRVKRHESDDVKIKQFVDYVKSLESPIYYLTTEKPKIETYEKYERPLYEYD